MGWYGYIFPTYSTAPSFSSVSFCLEFSLFNFIIHAQQWLVPNVHDAHSGKPYLTLENVS